MLRPLADPVEGDAGEVDVEAGAIVLFADDAEGAVLEDDDLAVDGLTVADLARVAPGLTFVLAEEDAQVVTRGAGGGRVCSSRWLSLLAPTGA